MNKTKPFLVGICGGTGSGKSMVAEKLKTISPKNIIILSHDNYYKDHSSLPIKERKFLNYDYPGALDNNLFLQHLKTLARGEAIDMPEYSFATHTRKKGTKKVRPTPIIIVEGILIFSLKKLIKAFDLTIYIDVDDDIRLARRLRRDVGKRDKSYEESLKQYLTSAQPMFEKYVLPVQNDVDIVLNNNGTLKDLQDGIDTVAARLKQILKEC